jgi:hypothetical protein
MVALRGPALAVVVLLCATLDSSLAKAPVKLLVPGSHPTCGTYTAERGAGQGQQLQYWVLGYLSAANVFGDQNGDLLSDLDGHAVWSWIDNYCRNHPLARLTEATDTLYRELINRHSGGK